MNTMRKAMLFGLAALSLTKEKAEEIIDDLVKRGEMSEKDRGAMVEKLLKEAETQKGVIEEKVSALAQKIMTDMGVLTQKDLKNILKRLDGIERKVGTANIDKQGTKA
jgi:polyhydroxyalkanoate synthesis regulator phasin